MKTTNIEVFNGYGFTIRAIIDDNSEIWFVGKDIAEILGYTNPQKAVTAHVDEEDRKILEYSSFSQNGKSLWEGSDYSNKTIINESGLYSLILSSKLPTAKQFKHWVTSEVIPSIRKHGTYLTPKTQDELINNPDFIIRLAQEIKAERAKNQELSAQVETQSRQIEELQPKASYYDHVLQSENLVPIRDISKDYGWSAIRMNQFLHEQGVQYKAGDRWLLYQKYAECGYTGSKTFANPDSYGGYHASTHTYWTQKGRLFIYKLMKANGYLPLMER